MEKKCPNCGANNHFTESKCIDCGFVFSKPVNIKKKVKIVNPKVVTSNDDLISQSDSPIKMDKIEPKFRSKMRFQMHSSKNNYTKKLKLMNDLITAIFTMFVLFSLIYGSYALIIEFYPFNWIIFGGCVLFVVFQTLLFKILMLFLESYTIIVQASEKYLNEHQ